MVVGLKFQYSGIFYLRILQERLSVIDASPGSVGLPRTLLPSCDHHLLVPGSLDAEVALVGHAADHEVGEVGAKVVKRHPKEVKKTHQVNTLFKKVTNICTRQRPFIKLK